MLTVNREWKVAFSLEEVGAGLRLMQKTGEEVLHQETISGVPEPSELWPVDQETSAD